MNHPVCIAPLMQPPQKFQSAADDTGALKSGIKGLKNLYVCSDLSFISCCL